MKEVKSQKIKTNGLKTLLALGKRMHHDINLHLRLTNYAKKVCLQILLPLSKQILNMFFTCRPWEITDQT